MDGGPQQRERERESRSRRKGDVWHRTAEQYVLNLENITLIVGIKEATSHEVGLEDDITTRIKHR